jgi:ribosome maturation factor RimP
MNSKIQQMIAPTVEALGYEMLGVEYLTGSSLLRVYIDSEAGIGIDDCTAVSHQISGILEVDDPIKTEYRLEVSSPGMERPLFTIEHYKKFLTYEIKLKTAVPVSGRKKFIGILTSVQDDKEKTISLEMNSDKTGKELVEIPLTSILNAHLTMKNFL